MSPACGAPAYAVEQLMQVPVQQEEETNMASRETTGAEDRRNRREREHLAELARSFRKDPKKFVHTIEEAHPPGVAPAAALLDAAIVLAEQDEFKPAMALLERSEELFKASGDTAGLARVYINMGPLYGMLDQLEKGISISHQAEVLAKDLPPDLEFTLHYASDLGGMYTELERWDDALRYLKIACDTAHNMGNAEVETDALLIMSQVAVAQGDAVTARKLAEQGGALGKQLQEKLFQARALQTLGDASALDGEHNRALELFQQALDLEGEETNIDLREQLFWEMSEAYENLGNQELAEDYRNRAADLDESGDDDDGIEPEDH